MKLAGVVIDFYDDLNGQVLKDVFPTADSLPGVIKEAHILSSKEREVLRDEAYALIMRDDGGVFRKFACVDSGNLALSMIYLEKVAHRLPTEAVSAAADSLLSFCNSYGLEPTPFVKSAGHKARAAARIAGAAAGAYLAHGAVRPRLNSLSNKSYINSGFAHRHPKASYRLDVAGDAAASALGAYGGNKLVQYIQKALARDKADTEANMPEMLEIARKADHEKHESPAQEAAEHTPGGRESGGNKERGENGMENSKDKETLTTKELAHSILAGNHGPEASAKLQNAISKKSAMNKHSASTLFRRRDPEAEPVNSQDARWARDTNINSIQGGYDQGKVVSTASQLKTASILDVSTKAPPVVVEKRASHTFALDDKYPLDSFTDVQKAVNYFDNYWTSFTPPERHEYAVKTAARAEELGIQTSERLHRYGSTEYAPDVNNHVLARNSYCNEEFHPVYEALKEKKASIHPEVFAHLLAEADQISGLAEHWGGHVCDPWMSTFGGKTELEKKASWSWENEGQSVGLQDLQSLAASDRMSQSFPDDLVSAFKQDPATIFDSLPVDTKKIIANMTKESSHEAHAPGSFWEGAKEEALPALGATIGAGLAKKYGLSVATGAAAGYGAGSIPDIVRELAARRKAHTTP